MTAAEVAARLKGVRRSGRGYMAQCPAHADDTASLAVDDGVDGHTLVYCHAGCSTEAVMDALSLTMRDLMAKIEAHYGNSSHESLRPSIVAEYDYTDEDGKLLFQVVRMDPKRFWQRRPDGAGGWKTDLNGTRRVLYRLPAVVEAAQRGRTVCVTEGEKDADRATSLGLKATTCCQGAGKWRPEYSECLRGAHVVVLPDNDEPGERHAEEVARSVAPYAASVKVVHLPGLPPKGDLSDFLDAGGTVDALVKLVREAPAWQPSVTPIGGTLDPCLSPPATTIPTACVERLKVDEWASRSGAEMRWLVPGLVPSCHLTMLTAAQKVGKSTLLRNLISAVTTGGKFLGRDVEKGTVLYLPLEESPAQVLEHLERLGANTSMVEVPTVRRSTLFTTDSGAVETLEVTEVLADVSRLEGIVRSMRPALVAIDPLVRLIRFSDLNSYDKTYRSMGPLLSLALGCGPAVVFVVHEGKLSSDRESVGHRSVGSVALPSVAATTISMTNRQGVRTIENEGRGVDALGKLVLDMNAETGAITVAGTFADLAARRAAESLLRAAETITEFTRPELLDAAEGKQQDKQRAFADLLDTGQLVKVSGAGKKGDPFRYDVAERRNPGIASTASIASIANSVRTGCQSSPSYPTTGPDMRSQHPVVSTEPRVLPILPIPAIPEPDPFAHGFPERRCLDG